MATLAVELGVAPKEGAHRALGAYLHEPHKYLHLMDTAWGKAWALTLLREQLIQCFVGIGTIGGGRG